MWLNILKALWTGLIQFGLVYFAGKQAQKAKEAQHDRDQAIDLAGRMADRADDAGELSQRFADRARRADNDQKL